MSQADSPKPAKPKAPPLGPPPKSAFNYIQGFVGSMDGTLGTTILRVASVTVGFFLLAVYFDWHGTHGFYTREAMEAAHLGRRLAEGHGYTTDSIRPVAVGMLQRAHPSEAAGLLQKALPDLSVPPAYPFALAVLMKVLPFDYTANHDVLWSFEPDLWITGFNQILFFAAAFLVFRIARRLFDDGVAWVSAIVFCGSEVFWRFSSSGLSTMLLLLIFLAMTWCLATLEWRERQDTLPPPGPSVWLAMAAGALTGMGGLTRYAFAWMILPVCLFLALFIARQRVKLTLAAGAAFLVVMAPWVARNAALSHNACGTAGYAFFQNTRPNEEDRVERSFDPDAAGLRLLRVGDLVNKFLGNGGRILRDELPRLGGTWASAFFLCGLLLPFRNGGLRRLRWFLVWSLALLAIVQAMDQTYLSAESPEINSENLLVVLAPLAIVYGVGFFFILLDQMALPDLRMRPMVAGIFAAAMCLPLAVNLAAPWPAFKAENAYVPSRIQKTAALAKPGELLMSDIPWAVAWYGNQPCAWLTLDDGKEFQRLNDLKAVAGIYLTARTADRPFLSQLLDASGGWRGFYLNALPPGESSQGMVPNGFPLSKAEPGYVPAEMFLTNPNRATNGTAEKVK